MNEPVVKMTEGEKITRLDSILNLEMECLELDGNKKTLNKKEPELENRMYPRRSKRMKIRQVEKQKRRTATKPKKIVDGYSKEIVNYYLDKKIKRTQSSLETIFEEPINDGCSMGARKLKRCIGFPDIGIYIKDKIKVKKRLMKAKKVCGIKKIKKLSMDLLLEKLRNIEQGK